MKSSHAVAGQTRILVTALVLAIAALTALYGSLGLLKGLDQRITGIDSRYYYAYLPSLLLDRDLDLSNNFRKMFPAAYEIPRTPKGRMGNPFSIGPAIHWSPFFLLGHLATLAVKDPGETLSADGHSRYYYLAVYLGDFAYGAAGLILVALFLRSYCGTLATLVGTFTILLASPVTYYLWSPSAMSHNVELFTVGLFLLAWRTRGMGTLAALSAGLMILTRWQNIVLLLPVALTTLAGAKRSLMWVGTWARAQAGFLLVVAVVFLPQAMTWNALYGQYLLVPQGQSFLNLENVALWQVLFSPRHGLFFWHPLLLAGVAGWSLLWPRHRLFTLGLLLAFTAEVVVNASVADWWAGWSFGQRRFIGMMPFLALGIAVLIERLRLELRRGPVVAILVLSLAAAWNLAFAYQYFVGLFPRAQAPTSYEVLWQKFNLRRDLEARVFSRQALDAFRANDLPAFVHFADAAYSRSPNYRASRPLEVVRFLITGDQAHGYTEAQRWRLEMPDSHLAAWAEAEFLLRSGRREEALTAISSATDSPNKERLRHLIVTGSSSIITAEYFRSFYEHLFGILYD